MCTADSSPILSALPVYFFLCSLLEYVAICCSGGITMSLSLPHEWKTPPTTLQSYQKKKSFSNLENIEDNVFCYLKE